MGHQGIQDAIVGELQKITRGAAMVDGRTNIARDLGLDSLAVMDLVMALEDHFDISIPLDKIAETETVQQLTELVCSLQTEMEA